jgi:5-methyltetrahydropteroyltriglutamate--homocysteine methyltransferase
VGSYPSPQWLQHEPSEANLEKATKDTIAIQESIGIDLICDGELYRFDPGHPETNGMIDYFVRGLNGIRSRLTEQEIQAFRALPGMAFRRLPAGMVDGPITVGSLDLESACRRVNRLATKPVKFTLTGPHMLAKTIPNKYYQDLPTLTLALAHALATEVRKLDTDVVQLDEANLPGHPEDWPWALEAINIVLDAVTTKGAVHLCFGNYGGKRVQDGTWANLIDYLNGLHVDHIVLETKRRPKDEVLVLRELDQGIGLGLGVVDIKTSEVETGDEIARDLERLEKALGAGRIRYIHPDCGFWMLSPEVANAKMEALVRGRNLYEGIS